MNVIPSLPATEVARTRWSPELSRASADGEASAPGGTPATVALTRAGRRRSRCTRYEHDPRAASYGLEAADGARRRPGPGVQDPAGRRRRHASSVGDRPGDRPARPQGAGPRAGRQQGGDGRGRPRPSGRPGTSPAGSRRSARSGAHPTVRRRVGARPPHGLRLGRPARAGPRDRPGRPGRGSPRRSRTGSAGLTLSRVSRSSAAGRRATTSSSIQRADAEARERLEVLRDLLVVARPGSASQSSPASKSTKRSRAGLVGLADDVLEGVGVAQAAVLEQLGAVVGVGADRDHVAARRRCSRTSASSEPSGPGACRAPPRSRRRRPGS